jgi:hypothetical protein
VVDPADPTHIATECSVHSAIHAAVHDTADAAQTASERSAQPARGTATQNLRLRR